MIHRKLRVSSVFLVVVTVLGIAAAGCSPAGPNAPLVPATPSAPATPAAPPAAFTPIEPPPAQQAVPLASGTLPNVNFFSASSETVPPDSVVILVWSVSRADSVSISNGIGKVEAQGRYTVIPGASTAFILTATNPAGSVTAQAKVEVTDLQSASPHFRPGYSSTRVQMTAVVGSPLAIKLDTQTSRGYKWVIDYYDQSKLSYVSSKYTESNPLTRGVDGQQQFTFQPFKGGDTKIVVSNINEKDLMQFDSIIYEILIRSH